MIRRSFLDLGEQLIDESLRVREPWSDIVQGLIAEGLNEEEIASLLRPRKLWLREAAQMKAKGYPYDEIVYYLRSLLAPWEDVLNIFLGLGLSLADTLRTLLPATEGEESLAVALALQDLEFKRGEGSEAQAVLSFYGIPSP